MIARWLLFLVGLLLVATVKADEAGATAQQYLATLTVSGPLVAGMEWRLIQLQYLNDRGALFARATQAGLNWTARPWLSLGAAYRLIHIDDATGSWNRQRIILSSGLTWRPQKWSLGYRVLWQKDWRDPGESGFHDLAYLRNVAQVRYTAAHRVTPYATLEIWNRVDSHRVRSGVDRTRYTVGADARLNQRQTLGFYERKQSYASDARILMETGAEYTYAFR